MKCGAVPMQGMSDMSTSPNTKQPVGTVFCIFSYGYLYLSTYPLVSSLPLPSFLLVLYLLFLDDEILMMLFLELVQLVLVTPTVGSVHSLFVDESGMIPSYDSYLLLTTIVHS